MSNSLESGKEAAMVAEHACACGQEVPESVLMARLDQVIAEYKGTPGALIPVLQLAQGIFGYLPESVQRHVATGLGDSVAHVNGVVTFYSFFTTVPRGKHLVRVCLGTACYVRGGKKVLDTMKQKLDIDVGETTPDRMFSLEIARCFGSCGLAPTLTVDDEVHQRVKPAKLPELLNFYRNKPDPTGKGE
jgi:NADH:ubiquinone oxidoreductase subunit E